MVKISWNTLGHFSQCTAMCNILEKKKGGGVIRSYIAISILVECPSYHPCQKGIFPYQCIFCDRLCGLVVKSS
jgi:hypothetical protein